MFNLTFLKFLITFAIIIAASFLVMGVAGGLDPIKNLGRNVESAVLK